GRRFIERDEHATAAVARPVAEGIAPRLQPAESIILATAIAGRHACPQHTQRSVLNDPPESRAGRGAGAARLRGGFGLHFPGPMASGRSLSMTAQTKGRIRHIALSVEDPWETAE